MLQRLPFVFLVVLAISGHAESEQISPGMNEHDFEVGWKKVMEEKVDNECQPGADVGIIVDGSMSIKLFHFIKLLKLDLAMLIDQFTVGPNATHIGLILFARSAELSIRFTDEQYYSNDAVKQRIREAPERLRYHTRTDLALKMANEELFGGINTGDRPDMPNYLIVLTDGRPYPPNRVAPFNETVPPLEAKGVKIVAVGIGREFRRDIGVLGKIAGTNGQVERVANYSVLGQMIHEIVQRMCDEDCGLSEWGDWSECSAPCNGGAQTRTRTCTNPPPRGRGKTYEEQKDELGPLEESRGCNTWSCDEQSCYPGIDLVIIVDASKSIRTNHFKVFKNALIDLVGRFLIGSNNTRVGLIEFDRKAVVWFTLADKQYYNLAALQKKIAEIPPILEPHSRMDLALEKARTLFGDKSLGDRPDKANFLFVFTDGRPYPEKKIKPFSETIPPLEALNVTMVSIGIGKKEIIRTEILKQIAGKNGHVVRVDNMSHLKRRISLIVSEACDRDGGYSHWSRWGSCSATCDGGEQQRSRSCNNPPPRGKGKNCDHLGSATEIQECNTRQCAADE